MTDNLLYYILIVLRSVYDYWFPLPVACQTAGYAVYVVTRPRVGRVKVTVVNRYPQGQQGGRDLVLHIGPSNKYC